LRCCEFVIKISWSFEILASYLCDTVRARQTVSTRVFMDSVELRSGILTGTSFKAFSPVKTKG
jgi:hypothetical protein